jgi:hypothetical protein
MSGEDGPAGLLAAGTYDAALEFSANIGRIGPQLAQLKAAAGIPRRL